ncbi:alpha/beta fold hydrolase [Embleya scabrispora]|uniref:alpha/beta fold hydrolase n=1 Tax=Embleya scabrispora TaxID=159449 RepID=UPI0003607022|nr:alpha/beta hydrolase [Embleya scabrispora]
MKLTHALIRRPMLAAVVATTVFAAAVTVGAAEPAPAAAASAREHIPVGFGERKAELGAVDLNYVIGGHGPTLVLIHGYPQTWYEWHDILPALAQHYTVIAPDLRGAGKSDAPATGYDKKTMADDIHRLLVALGRDQDVRIVGHDIGTMVAYAYAAAHPTDVTKLVLSEAPIPDLGIYQFPALTADGPGVWNFGFFSVANGLPEAMIRGRERTWTDRFIDQLEFRKGSVTAHEVAVFARYLKDRDRLNGSLAWFRAFPQDIADNAAYVKTPLTMPVLAIGADHSLDDTLEKQAIRYATNVTGKVIGDSGHWIYEEHPAELTGILLAFLNNGP